jgi:hypothetical protein
VCVCITGTGNCRTDRECCSRSCTNIGSNGIGKCACDPPGTVRFDDVACCSNDCQQQGHMDGTCA